MAFAKEIALNFSVVTKQVGQFGLQHFCLSRF